MNLGNKNWNLMNEFTSKAALYLTKMPGAAMTAGRAIVPGLPINSQDRP
jgi:hypothetical protein